MAVVLIVDDEQVVRQVLMRLLQPTGHEIREAESAEAALQFLEAQPAAVVFSDIQMPGHDGIWLTTQIRQRYPATAVVLATAVSTVPPRFSMQAGVLAYIVKPFTPAAVTDALAAALDWHNAARAGGAGSNMNTEQLQSWLDSLI
jgi:CheY-like chemotaxis protein